MRHVEVHIDIQRPRELDDVVYDEEFDAKEMEYRLLLREIRTTSELTRWHKGLKKLKTLKVLLRLDFSKEGFGADCFDYPFWCVMDRLEKMETGLKVGGAEVKFIGVYCEMGNDGHWRDGCEGRCARAVAEKLEAKMGGN